MRASAPSAHVRPVRLTLDVSCSGIPGGGRSVIHSDYKDVIEQTMKFNAVALQHFSVLEKYTDSNQLSVII